MIKKRIGVLISGSGSNMEQLAKASMAADYPAEIVLVISDKKDAKGLDRAKTMGIQSIAIASSDYTSKADHEAAILTALDEAKLDFVCLAGFMRILSGNFIEQCSPPMSGRWPPVAGCMAAQCISSPKAWTKVRLSAKLWFPSHQMTR